MTIVDAPEETSAPEALAPEVADVPVLVSESKRDKPPKKKGRGRANESGAVCALCSEMKDTPRGLANFARECQEKKCPIRKKPIKKKGATSATIPKGTETKIGELILTVGGLVAVANPVDGQAIIVGAPRLASALVKVAETNPAIARLLAQITSTSAYGELAVAVGLVAFPIALNHSPTLATRLGPVVGSLINPPDIGAAAPGAHV